MAEQLTGTVVAEKYRLDSLLRSGDLGDFYRGRHLFMDKSVTLKVLPHSLAVDDEIREQFSADARSEGALENIHILNVSDFGTGKDGSCFVVYEGFDGEPLIYSVGTGGQFSIERAITIARQVADALNSAHEAGFIHGNLTPDSILVANSESSANVKVFDFEPAETANARSTDERGATSVAYLAPETFSGLRPIDARSDIYSLGIILYQMLAGEVPFKGETPTDVMLKHAEEEPPALSEYRKDVPPLLESLIRKALAKDPDERIQTAAEFIEELDKAWAATLNGGSGRFWKTAAAVVIGIGVLAAALIYATSSKQTMPITQLQPDANGQPVQPINPATGAEEQTLAAMPSSLPGSMSNSDIIAQPPGTLPGGDNYNPWATGAPPPGAPPQTYVPPGGGYYTVDPNTGSPFMPNDGVILVPVPANTDAQPKASPTPKTPAANVNTQVAPPANTAKPTTPEKPAATENKDAKPARKTGGESGQNKPLTDKAPDSK